MSSAAARFTPIVGRAIRGIVWTAVFAALAAGAAGLIAQASHAPGSPARADLTYTGDAALNARLDAATAQLEAISANVDRLAEDAKTALEQVASADQTRLQQSLQDGSETAATIDTETVALLDSLVGLPGDEPDATLHYGNDTLVRRAAVLAALDAGAGLDANWQQVTAKALEVSRVTALIAQHDQTVLDAAAQGRTRKYADAAATLDQALLGVVSVKDQRDKLIADTSRTVLDEWIERNRDYDTALQALYLALVQSHGDPTTVRVQVARRNERDAFDRLPPDRRTIIVIVAEVARGGLTQAVLAIEDARGRLDDALAAAGAPDQSGAPGESVAPNDTGGPETQEPGDSGVPLP